MKYFDSDFFKFTFGFLAIVSIGLLLIIGASYYVDKSGDNSIAKPAAEMQNGGNDKAP